MPKFSVKATAPIVAGVVVLLLAAYFWIVPMVQVNNYKATVSAKHGQLNESLNKVTALLDRDVFVKSDVEPSVIRSDVKAGNEAIKDAENTLGIVSGDLTSFSALPLLSWQGSYKAATDVDSQEEQYIANARDFLKEMKAVLAYFDKSADLSTKFIEFNDKTMAALDAETPQQYASEVEGAIQKLSPEVDTLAALEVPASLKEGHDYGVKAMREIVDLYKQSADAAKAEDMDKMDEVDLKIVEKAEEMIKKSDDFNAKFVRESPLRKVGDKLNELDRSIDRAIAGL